MRSLSLPRDPWLPGLAALFNTDLLKQRLDSQIDGNAGTIPDCQVVYVRHRPGRYCLASYAILRRDPNGDACQEPFGYGICFPAEKFDDAYQQAIAKNWVSPRVGQPVTALIEERILLFAYPTDRRLSGLQTLHRQDTLEQLINTDLKERLPTTIRLTPCLVSYKPEKRAVLRGNATPQTQTADELGSTSVYLKVYSDDRGGRLHDVMTRLHKYVGSRADFTIPRPLGIDESRHILVMSALSGERLLHLPIHTLDPFERTAQALAGLHAYQDPELPQRTAADHVTDAREALDSLIEYSPEQTETISEIRRLLTLRAPRDGDSVRGFVHGEFHPDQVVVDPRTIGIFDLDEAHHGPVAHDLGKFLADLHSRHPDKAAQTVAEAFLRAYNQAAQTPLKPEAVSWWVAAALLLIAVRPIRRLDDDGPEEVKQLLNKVQRMLRGT